MEKTGNFKTPDFYRHTYRVKLRTKSYTVFEMIDSDTGKNYLTDILRIEDYRKKSNATGINTYLRLRTANSWSASEQVTGLRPTKIKRLYQGNRVKKDSKSLLIFLFTEGIDQFTQEPEVRLIVDVYNCFYPANPKILDSIVKNYEAK